MIQEKLAQMAIELDSARLLTYRAAAAADAGAQRVTTEAAKAKAFASEAAQLTQVPLRPSDRGLSVRYKRSGGIASWGVARSYTPRRAGCAARGRPRPIGELGDRVWRCSVASAAQRNVWRTRRDGNCKMADLDSGS